MDHAHFKQIIDNSRDILMGKLPSPIAQVDAISYALIYKFMSDTDDDSAALGGKRTYFSGEYEKYSWHNLMSPTITGADRVILYRNALENMSRNPNIPPLFREIFKVRHLDLLIQIHLTYFFAKLIRLNKVLATPSAMFMNTCSLLWDLKVNLVSSEHLAISLI